MNRALAEAAEAAITDPGFEEDSGYCQRFARQCIAKVYGNKYEPYRASSAKQTGLNFLHAGHGDPYTGQALEIGDVLYVTHGSGGYGHVGILVDGNKVAENSTAHRGGPHGAKGYRLITKFPHPNIIVRLPEPGKPSAAQIAPKPGPRLILGMTGSDKEINYDIIEDAELKDGRFHVNSKDLANLMGVSATHLKGGVAPIVDVLTALGVPPYKTDLSHLHAANDPRAYVFIDISDI